MHANLQRPPDPEPPAGPAPVAVGALFALAVATLLLSAPARAAGPGSVAPILERADTLFAHQDWRRAAAAYREAAKAEPATFRTWFRLGACEAALERWDGAIAAYRRADALPGSPLAARYNLACAFARGGQADSALVSLGLLMDRGYRQVRSLESDPDLASLRDRPAFAAVLERARRNATPCAFRPESRQFDFWIGEWEVFDRRSGTRVGSSRIESILDQCVILENWTGFLGGTGKSFNLWNPQTACWQQTWVSNSGTVTYYDESRVEGESLVFFATGTSGGVTTRTQLRFSPEGTDRVRQWSQVSSDGGSTWSTNYDFEYRRKP